MGKEQGTEQRRRVFKAVHFDSVKMEGKGKRHSWRENHSLKREGDLPASEIVVVRRCLGREDACEDDREKSADGEDETHWTFECIHSYKLSKGCEGLIRCTRGRERVLRASEGKMSW